MSNKLAKKVLVTNVQGVQLNKPIVTIKFMKI
jgi:hypothetical protein